MLLVHASLYGSVFQQTPISLSYLIICMALTKREWSQLQAQPLQETDRRAEPTAEREH